VAGQGVGGAVRAALADGNWSMPRLVGAVRADPPRGRARQLPTGTPDPTEWVRQQQEQWTRPKTVWR
jgi:hypothetical protein